MTVVQDTVSTMAGQVSVIVPDDLYELLQELAQETNRPLSSLCAAFIREGVYNEIERLNKIESWRGMVAQRKARQQSLLSKNSNQADVS